MPWRPVGQERVGPVVPVAAAVDERPADALASVPAVDAAAAVADGEVPASLADAYEIATRVNPKLARRSKLVLILFSGPKRRPNGIEAYLAKLGFEAVMFDILSGGNILEDDVFADLMRRVSPPRSTRRMHAQPSAVKESTRGKLPGCSQRAPG